jgi:hypothetical protein
LITVVTLSDRWTHKLWTFSKCWSNLACSEIRVAAGIYFLQLELRTGLKTIAASLSWLLLVVRHILRGIKSFVQQMRCSSKMSKNKKAPWS